MPRKYAQLKLSIWADEDFRALTPAGQHLYFVLLTSTSLTHCGICDWRPHRIASLAGGWTEDDVWAAAVELTERLYLVVDTATEEALIRSFIRHDEVLKQPRLTAAMVSAWTGAYSTTLRAVIVHELVRLREEVPELRGWGVDGVTEMLSKPAADPADLSPIKANGNPCPNPSGNPYPRGSGKGIAKGFPPSPTPTPAPITSTSGDSHSSSPGGAVEPEQATKSTRGTRLPDGWRPSDDVIAAMTIECPGFDLRTEHRVFTDYWRAQPGQRGVKVDWPATWRNWMRKAYRDQRRPPGTAPRRSTTDERVAQAQALKRGTRPTPPITEQLAIGGPE